MVRLDGPQEVTGAAVMKEEYALAEAPERRAAKHIAGRKTLGDVIRNQ
jgi:hypothetical protein